MRCKENLKSGKSKYEINTNFPLARARRLWSDVHDSSPSFLPLVGSSQKTGRGRTLDLPPHLLRLFLSSRCGGSVFWLGFRCTPECLPFSVLLYHEALLFPLLEPEKHILPSDTETYFSLSDIDPCLGGPQKRSPKYEVDSEVTLHIHYHKVGKDEGVSYSYKNVFGYPFGIPNG